MLLALGALALLTGLYGGLFRLGWSFPYGDLLASLHGPLLLSGLFGTLISLERAVALGRDWSYAAPLLSGLGTVALLMGAPFALGAGAYVLAAAALIATSGSIMVRQPEMFMAALVVGALAWLTGNLLWLMGSAVPDAAGWWLAFLILTVAGERLELSRLMVRRRGSEVLFLLAGGLLITGACYGILSDRGAILFGLALILMTGWLFRHDIARRNIHQKGQTRFFAACMISGYIWLGLAGVGLIGYPPGNSAFGYDLALHAVLIGFVLSMVFGHALIILPAIVRLRIVYRPVLYVPLATLHVSLVLRGLGDVLEWQAGRQWSGIVTLLALVGFMLSVATAAKRRREQSDAQT
jgi:hypothetical protein